MGPIGCPETSAIKTTTRCVTAQKSAVLIYFAAEAWNDGTNIPFSHAEPHTTVYSYDEESVLERKVGKPAGSIYSVQ